MTDDLLDAEGALPLLDHELEEPGMRDYINGLVLAEMDAMAAEGADELFYAARLPPLPPSRLSAAQLAELERVAAALPAPPPAAAGAPSPPPPPPPPPDAPARAWRASADAAAIALERQGLAALNGELAARYGGEAWRAAAEDSAALLARVRSDVGALAARVAAVNAARTGAQEAAVGRLAALRKRAREQQGANLALAGALADAGSRGGLRARSGEGAAGSGEAAGSGSGAAPGHL
jgi:hypothetical protein